MRGWDRMLNLRRYIVRFVILIALVGSALLSMSAEPPSANAWDSAIPRADSHTAITHAAIEEILNDPTEPQDFKAWIRSNEISFMGLTSVNVLELFSSKYFTEPLGELVHPQKRPLDNPVELSSCEPLPLLALANNATGSARWAVGNNPGDTHPEYWWQTALCLWRTGHPTLATAVLGQLLHSIQDQGSPPHAYYKKHGGIGGIFQGSDQSFETFSQLSSYDNTYYRHPDSVFYPGKNVLDIANHGDGEDARFYIPKKAGWTPINLSPRAADPRPAYLQTPSPTRLRLDFSVVQIGALPKIGVRAVYEKADGGIGAKEATLQLNGLGWTHWTLTDNFAPNGRLWLYFNRTEKAYRTSTGQVQVYTVDSRNLADEVTKPALNHPWEYYDWLREWTQWAMENAYWRRYFPGLDDGGDLNFDVLWATAPNSERAVLSMQWAISQRVIRWALEDAYWQFTHTSYDPSSAIGQGYKVALYQDSDYNSSGGDDDSPEYITSYAIGCEPYDGKKCGSFVAPAWNDAHANVGDGLFAPAGTGSRVTMKANTLPAMLNNKISSLEVRGATVYLYPGPHLTGDPRVVTTDTANLGEFNDRTQSIRIVPTGAADPPTARDDTAFTAVNAPVAINVMANDSVDPADVTITARRPRYGTATVADGKITYTPNPGIIPGPLVDTFSYEVTDNATGVADAGTVSVHVGGVNHGPRDVALDVVIEDSPVTTSNEGQEVTATGSFVDEDPGDTHQVTIDWGDGSALTTVPLAAGVSEFSAPHAYRDNNRAGSPFRLTATVTDSGGLSASDVTNLEVLNVAPIVVITDVMGDRPFAPVGVDVPVAATFADPGTDDTHVGTVEWGDGITEDLGAVSRSGLTATHAFEAAGTYSSHVSVTDNDGGAGTAIASVTVLSPTAASVALADRLGALVGHHSPVTDTLLRKAVAELASRNGGTATNGANALLLAGDNVAAIVKLSKVESALRSIADVDVTTERLLNAQIAQSVAQSTVRDARIAAGCVDITASSCSGGDRKSLNIIEGLMSRAMTAISRGEYAAAINDFKNAAGRAMELAR